MDPFLLTRIGDVTIQRVLPKQDAPKKETASDHQTSTSGSPLGELDLSMKNRSSSSIDKADDKGGGERSFGDTSNYSDASDMDDEGDVSDEIDEDDEQDVPLSLVTTKRNPDEMLSYNPTSSSGPGESVTCPTSQSNLSTQENKISENKPTELDSQLLLNQIADIGMDKESSDNDDDLPLSRLIAEADNEAGEEESDAEDDKYNSSRDKPVSIISVILRA